MEINDLHMIEANGWNAGFEYGFRKGYNKAIDDFAEKLKRENKETIPTHSGYCRMSFDEVVDEIAEQLKVGGKNERSI